MKSIAIITARGGSKRIPRKNIKEFCGRPIISYSIEAALKSNIYDEVMVSTDDLEIAEISKRYGAAVPFFRSAENSGDFKNETDAAIEVIHEYRKLGLDFDIVSIIYPTAPFITPEKLKNGMKTFIESGADSLVPVVRFGFPPQRGYSIRDGKLHFLHPEYIQTRSQDLEPIYHDVGQFYFVRTEVLLKYEAVVTENMVTMVIPEEEAQDIDNESDWRLAEIKYKLLNPKAD